MISWITYKNLAGIKSQNGVYWKRGDATSTNDGWPAYYFTNPEHIGKVKIGCLELSRKLDKGEYTAVWRSPSTSSGLGNEQ
jgi:hypothetical protein